MTEEQKISFDRLKQGLAHHDSFGAVPDTQPVYIDYGNCLYELPYGIGETLGQLSLGDLRIMLAAFEELS